MTPCNGIKNGVHHKQRGQYCFDIPVMAHPVAARLAMESIIVHFAWLSQTTNDSFAKL